MDDDSKVPPGLSGYRGRKIRTYNYKANRVTDHRTGRQYSLQEVVDGALDELSDDMRVWWAQYKLDIWRSE